MRPYLLATALLVWAGCTLIASSDELQSGKQAASSDCVLNSDCASDNVCIFRVCSQPCQTDRDCTGDQVCLVTSEGAACVATENNACSAAGDCPGGTRCDQSTCKTVCGSEKKLACLEGQSCIEGLCEGNAPLYDAGNGGSNLDASENDNRADGSTPSDGGNTDAEVDLDASGVDPCKDHCDPRVSCDVVAAGAVCGACPGGFRDVNDDGTECTDIDECSGTTPPACDVNASCVNTPGSALCKCASGYNGTGLVCLKNVACPVGNECGANATCTAISGESFCVCKAGYAGDGGSCADINECMLNTDGCDDGPEACVNDAGSFHCTCPSGYDGSAMGANGCADIDECGANSDGCDDAPDACSNSIGGFSCQCPPGYTGSGTGSNGCADVNECASNNGGCDANATCNNSQGSSSCACNCGYSGSGTTCTQTSNYEGNGPTAGFNGTLSTSAGYAYGYKINLGSAARLLNYGVISRSAGPKVRFALYTDTAGAPGTLVAQSPLAGKTTSVGIVLALSADACTALAAGDYWLFMVPDQALDIASASAGSATFRYVAFSFANAFPANLTGTVSSSGAPFAAFFVAD